MREFNVRFGGHVAVWPTQIGDRAYDTGSAYQAMIRVLVDRSTGLTEGDALEGLAQYLEALARDVRKGIRK